MKLSLRWTKCPYRIERRFSEPGPIRTVWDAADREWLEIVPAGNEWPPYDPCNKVGLCGRLADRDSTPEGALDFVNAYGLLRAAETQRVADVCAAIDEAKALIAARENGDADYLIRWSEAKADAMRLVPVFDRKLPPPRPHAAGDWEAEITWQKAIVRSRQPRFEWSLRPRDLYGAIFLSFFRETADTLDLRQCARAGCGEWFAVGAGTGRRGTKQYCSNSCRNAALYQRKTARGAQ